MVTMPGLEGAVKVTGAPDKELEDEKEPPVVEPVEVKDHVTPEFDKSPVTIGVSESFCVTVSPPRKGVKVTTTLLVVVVEELLQPARVTIPTKIKTKETTDWAR